jgi:hypothetical protein
MATSSVHTLRPCQVECFNCREAQSFERAYIGFRRSLVVPGRSKEMAFFQIQVIRVIACWIDKANEVPTLVCR